jgi:hypothetical protein
VLFETDLGPSGDRPIGRCVHKRSLCDVGSALAGVPSLAGILRCVVTEPLSCGAGSGELGIVYWPPIRLLVVVVPLLVLVVVREQEGVSVDVRGGVPLPVLRIGQPAVPADELPDLTDS